MGTDCKFQGVTLDRWYVFSEEFYSGEKCTKEETLKRLLNLKKEYEEQEDKSYHLYWVNKTLQILEEEIEAGQEEFCFYADYDDRYYDE